MFDKSWLSLPRWTPRSALGATMHVFNQRVAKVADGWFAMTNPAGGAESDPGIGGLLWASTSRVALHVVTMNMDAEPFVDESPAVYPSGLSLPATFAAIVRSAREAGVPVRQNATYAVSTGEFKCSELSVLNRSFYFREPNPNDDDAPIAVLFPLK
jgi:hypothetical protein